MRVSAKKSDMGLIRVEDLHKVCQTDQEKIVALSRINPAVASGEVCCILETSDSGKSTLLNIAVGLGELSKSRAVIDDVEVTALSEKDPALFRQKNIDFVSQSYNPMPTLSTIENVAIPLMFWGTSKDQRNREAVKMLYAVRLDNRLLYRPTRMSGGRQQRVGIARALVAHPEIMFADESAGNLDSETTKEVMEIMVGMTWEYQETLILVTHDQDIVRYADRTVTIVDGNIQADHTNKSAFPTQRQEKIQELTTISGGKAE